MKITERNNFCRVFELPLEYSIGFCFGGGISTPISMVDWFHPIILCQGDTPIWDEQKERLKKFILQKQYIKKGRNYLVITDFGEALIISGNLKLKSGGSCEPTLLND